MWLPTVILLDTFQAISGNSRKVGDKVLIVTTYVLPCSHCTRCPLLQQHLHCFTVFISLLMLCTLPFSECSNWDKFEDSFKAMLFSSGDKCWNGPDRSLKVLNIIFLVHWVMHLFGINIQVPKYWCVRWTSISCGVMWPFLWSTFPVVLM